MTAPGLEDIPRPGFWIGGDPAIELCDGRLFTQAQTDVVIVVQLWSHFGWARDKDIDAAHIEILGEDYPRLGGLCSEWYLREFPPDAYPYQPWRPAAPVTHLRRNSIGSPELRPTTQRGGIHTQAAVRWLARAAWGDRDLRWREPVVDETALRYSLLEIRR